jgi:beta-glucanase (GH16 family)
VLGHCSNTTYPIYPGYTLALVEDFDEPLDLVNDPNWTYSDGNLDAMYTRLVKEAISFSGGNAVLTATTPGISGGTSYAEGTLGAFPVTRGTSTVKSGELRTKHNNWRYGRFEARFKAAKNVNVTSAFFTFRNPKWQDWREIAFEITPAHPLNEVAGNLVKAQNAAAYPGGNTWNVALSSLTGGATVYDDYHVYVMINTETGFEWLVDGASLKKDASKLQEKSMKIMFNLWVFNSSAWGGGNPAGNTYPMSMLIDWVRLYKWDSDPIYPCSPLPDCQPAEDRDYQKNNAEDGLPAAAPW